MYEQGNLPLQTESGSLEFERRLCDKSRASSCKLTDSSVIAQISHPGLRERLKLGCRLERRFQPLAEAACNNRAF